MEYFWNNLTTIATEAGSKILLGIVILIVGLWIIRRLLKLLGKGKGFSKLDKGVRTFLISFLRILLYIVLFLSVAFLWGVPTTAFITLFTSVGVAVGLAFQGALSNFAGGILLLVFKPFKVGDFIENGDVMGTVDEITVLYTILISSDNKKITIPNGNLTNSNVINYSAKRKRRVDLVISASYKADIDLVEKVLLEVANENPMVLKDPAPLARLAGHGADALEYHFRVWCKSGDYWDVYYDCLENVKKKFDENKIEIPYKQVDVHTID